MDGAVAKLNHSYFSIQILYSILVSLKKIKLISIRNYYGIDVDMSWVVCVSNYKRIGLLVNDLWHHLQYSICDKHTY